MYKIVMITTSYHCQYILCDNSTVSAFSYLSIIQFGLNGLLQPLHEGLLLILLHRKVAFGQGL